MALIHAEARPDEEAIESFQDRLVQLTSHTLDLHAIHLGTRLGYYAALAANKALSPEGLARATGTHVRYAQEWLEHQTVTGIVRLVSPSEDPQRREYALPPPHAAVLADPEGPAHLAPIIQTAVGATRPIDAVEQAYRSGGGVPYADYGIHMRDGQGGVNRAMFLHDLGTKWFPQVPDIDERLRSTTPRPARVADLGCGAGWSCIALAKAYPQALVDGFDLDAASVALARQNVEAAGLEERVRIHRRDAATMDSSDPYDLVVAYECIHDMAQPAKALATMRRLAGDDGAVVVMDERVADTFSADADAVERLMYGWSVIHCLPAGRSEEGTCATGTVLRRPAMVRLAEAAGFGSVAPVSVLPIDNPFFRFYRLQ